MDKLDKSKVVIVTGGSRGIGACLCENLAMQGYRVVLNYNRSEEKAKEIQKRLANQNIAIDIYQANVAKKEEAQALCEYTLKKYHTIDVLINNAGIDQIQLFTEITQEDWDTMIQNNLSSAFFMAQEACKTMISQKEGCIINISSIWGMVGASCEVAYSVAKAGMDGLTKSLAKELAPCNIRVNSIAPGMIQTDMNKDWTEEELEEIKAQIPLGRIGKPKDVYACAKWLIEDEYTTGQVISPNGGWVI